MSSILRIAVAAVLAVAAPAPVSALRYVWTGSGHVTGIIAISDTGAVPTPAGSILPGDAMSFRLSFTTDHIEPGGAFDADPTLNLYWLTDLSISGHVGSFTFSGYRFGTDNLQLWNNAYEDGQIVSAGRPDNSGVPFEGGDAMELNGVAVFALGPATLRSTDLVSEMLPLADFPDRFLALEFYNRDTHLSINVYASYDGTAVAEPTPEPGTWEMMLTGFGLAGGCLRLARRGSPFARG